MNIRVLLHWLVSYMPFVALVVTYFLYVRPSRFSRRVQALWLAWILFCCAKFVCSDKLGGNVFYPEFPEKFIWFWNWAYSGVLLLGTFALVWWHRSRRWALPLAAWGLAAFGVWCGVKLPDVTRYTLEFDDLPRSLDGYRIVQISDTHVSSAARRWRLERIVEMANAEKPDLICLTGDYADGKASLRAPDVEPLRDLKARDGVYAITGNHEYYFKWAEWKKVYAKLGLRFLVNDCVFPRAGLALAGVNDKAAVWQRRKVSYDVAPDVRQAFAAATNGEFRVLLQHRPEEARANAKNFGVRLQLSGHTHGGVMPVLREIVRRSNAGFVRGLYELGRETLFVHAGSGQWAGCQVRFFDPAEVAVITLKRKRP